MLVHPYIDSYDDDATPLRNDSKNSMMQVDPFLTELNIEEEENSRVI